MNFKDVILSRFFEQKGDGTLFLPDLTLWYDFHHKRGTLPEPWRGHSLPEIARALGVPIWLPIAPWRVETRGVDITTTETEKERVIRSRAPSGTLVARWILGPDGDWWQTEYPVKTKEDLEAVLEIVDARTYVLDASALEGWTDLVGDDGVVALEIPRRPYSDLLHEFLGWSEGLLFLREPLVTEINDVLDAKLQRFVEEVANLPGQLILSPDNLDGQFISPTAFRQHLADSYQNTASVLHRHDKRLVVHIGGPIQRLLPLLTDAGVDGFEGICGPPQSDQSLAQARELLGSDPILWGGIPQDYISATHERQEFEAVVLQAAQEARRDKRSILGVADRVPVDAELSRLEAIVELVDRGRARF